MAGYALVAFKREVGAGLPQTVRRKVDSLTASWGTPDSVSLYLERCQVETPISLVEATWRHVGVLRTSLGKVVDYGAGDGRFAKYGAFGQYVGYEIDTDLCHTADLPTNASLLNRCAFSDTVSDADLCIGNPPFVRNQDLPPGWRQHASDVLYRRTGVKLSGLANAWQYFFLLGLISSHGDGLCALIVPYEWVSRPSARALREFIVTNRWTVQVYRLVDTTFRSVLTTASITIVDKSDHSGTWSYFEETSDGNYSPLPSPSGGAGGVIPYRARARQSPASPVVKRGLSPGTQAVLTLTEGERVRHGLNVDRDVVPCVTTLRSLPAGVDTLDRETFLRHYRIAGEKCWLIRTDAEPSSALQAYLASTPPAKYQTATCQARPVWWKFAMPGLPDILVAMSFRGAFPKLARNTLGARAVGGVYGIYGLGDMDTVEAIGRHLSSMNIADRVVAHSHGLRKLEVGQLSSLLFGALTSGALSGSRS